MKKRKTEKPSDCVAFKRQSQIKIYEQTKDMTVTEQVDYFRKRARSGTLGSWWRRVSDASAAREVATEGASEKLVVQESLGRYSPKNKSR